LRTLSEEERDALVRELGDDFADSWEICARDAQLPPAGDWWCWVLGSGRGYGKTRALSGSVHMAVPCGIRRMHLICPSYRDVVDVMVDGPSGILNTVPPGERPRWVASRRRVEWDGGATVTCFSAENFETLRGPECQFAPVDGSGGPRPRPTSDPGARNCGPISPVTHLSSTALTAASVIFSSAAIRRTGRPGTDDPLSLVDLGRLDGVLGALSHRKMLRN